MTNHLYPAPHYPVDDKSSYFKRLGHYRVRPRQHGPDYVSLLREAMQQPASSRQSFGHGWSPKSSNLDLKLGFVPRIEPS